MVMTIMYVGFAIILLILIASWIPWRTIFDKVWGNNPTKAKVYVEAGEQIILCQGRLSGDCPQGNVYRFKYFGKWQSVIVPEKYPFRYILGCRQIRLKVGDSVASPLGDMTSSSTRVSSSTLDAIFRAHIGKDLAQTVFGKTFNWMIIIIAVVGIVAVGFFLFRQFIATDIPVQPAGIEEPAPIQEKPDILE